MKATLILGARPQFIKAAPVSKALASAGHEATIVHTGQHYDYDMSEVFFAEMGLPEPALNLGVGSGPHGWQTGTMLIRLEEALLADRPDWVLVFGDTNSTLAAALAACKLRIPLAHVEAGLRSFNREMPEEHNRILTDHCSDLLFCPTTSAAEQLQREGVTKGVFAVGDPMYDAALHFGARAEQQSIILSRLGLAPKTYALATLHRPYTTDDPTRLLAVLEAFDHLDLPIILPLHPRTRQALAAISTTAPTLDFLLPDSRHAARNTQHIQLIEPVGYLDMLALERHARLILTDSGGVQKEAYFFAVPCITLRPETEWVETVAAGWNRLVWEVGDGETQRSEDAGRVGRREGHSLSALLREAVQRPWPKGAPPPVFGDGKVSEKIVAHLAAWNN